MDKTAMDKPVIPESGSEYIQEKYSGVMVVIPAFNEELTIGSVILKATPVVARIIVIDDGSRDKTAEVARLAGADVVSLQKKTGKGQAILIGLKRAYDSGCTAAVVLDGDGRHKTREIPWLVSHILNTGADFVVGSQFLETKEGLPVRQRLKLNMCLHRTSPNAPAFTEPFSGFYAFSRKALENLDFSFDEPDFHQRLISRMAETGMNIREVAISRCIKHADQVDWDYTFKVIAGIPALNEEDHIAKIVQQARQYVDLVVVVDDGSSDMTAAVAQQAGAYVVKHGKNQGYGAALRTIFSTARDLHAEALVTLDSDGQHDPAEIERVLEPLLGDADIVIGSRFLEMQNNQVPSYRKAGMKVLDTATTVAGAKTVTDTQSGFRAYGRRAIDLIRITGAGMSGGSEILIQAGEHNLNIAEVSVNVRYDIPGTSSQNPVSHGVSIVGRLISLISYRRPLLSFGLVGGILIVGGLLSELWVFEQLRVASVFHDILAVGSAFVLILGMLLLIAGLILNALVMYVKDPERRGL